MDDHFDIVIATGSIAIALFSFLFAVFWKILVALKRTLAERMEITERMANAMHDKIVGKDHCHDLRENCAKRLARFEADIGENSKMVQDSIQSLRVEMNSQFQVITSRIDNILMTLNGKKRGG